MLKRLAKLFPKDVSRNTFTERGKGISLSLGGIVSELKAKELLPEDEKQKDALIEALAMRVGGKYTEPLEIIAPVCPDYSEDGIGHGIGREAVGAMKATRMILDIFRNITRDAIKLKIRILIADTEDDIPEIIERSARNDIRFYQNCCRDSAIAIDNGLNEESRNTTSVHTFSDFLGVAFREAQYRFESLIKGMMSGDDRLRHEISDISSRRGKKYHSLLGRPEKSNELTIRYMAQYAALAYLMRKRSPPPLIMNYGTPNLDYLNAFQKHERLRLPDEPETILSVISYPVDR